MAKRHVYSKDITGLGDFIYVDLLPDVKRARQFNVNVVAALLFAIVLAFFLIYQPYRDNTFELEELSSINNDLKHEKDLTQEEFNGYEIDLAAIAFERDIDRFQLLRVDFNNLMDDVELIVDDNSGRLRKVTYDETTDTITFEVLLISQFNYNKINNELLVLDWVASSEIGPRTQLDGVEYIATFTVEVEYHVE
jgi:hypothetical protein